MDADAKVQAAAPSAAAPAPMLAAKPRERSFWIALACAAVAHAILIAGFVRLPPRELGEKGGRPDGVSVAMVDAADLASRSTFAEDAVSPGSAASAPASPTGAAPLPDQAIQQPKQEVAPLPSDGKAPGLVAPDETAKQGKAGKEQKRQISPGPLDAQALGSDVPPPDQTTKPRKADAPPRKVAKPAPPLQMPKPSPPLQLHLPDRLIAPGGKSAAFTRPAGITRSGENDEFGRRVIRALRKTMPHPGTMRGRVTVRILLTEDGNLAKVLLVRSSGNRLLDQNVLFAVQQSSFPFPPPRAPLVDRTFLVTYIYETG